MTLADWQLPPGTDRGLIDYMSNPELARQYDAALADTPLLHFDVEFTLRHLPPTGWVIDLGCGTGRLLQVLSERGYDCVGVDLSREMLTVAHKKLEKMGCTVSRIEAQLVERTQLERQGRTVFLIEANLVELDAIADATFDAAACLFSTFGMIRGQAARMQFLQHVHRLLKPGGMLILHAHQRWYHLRHRSGRWWALTNTLAAALGRCEPGERTMPQHHGGAPLTLKHFTAKELQTLLPALGFQIRTWQPIAVEAPIPAGTWWANLRAYGFLIAAQKPGAV